MNFEIKELEYFQSKEFGEFPISDLSSAINSFINFTFDKMRREVGGSPSPATAVSPIWLANHAGKLEKACLIRDSLQKGEDPDLSLLGIKVVKKKVIHFNGLTFENTSAALFVVAEEMRRLSREYEALDNIRRHLNQLKAEGE